jgi:hypothetical protein
MTRSRTEIARQSIDAWNGRNVEWLVETVSPDFEFVPLIASSVEGEAGVVRGSEAFRRFFVELDETPGIRRSRICAGRRRREGAKVSGALQSAIAAKGGV